MKQLLLPVLSLLMVGSLMAQTKPTDAQASIDTLKHKVESMEYEFKKLQAQIRQLATSINEVKEQNIRLKAALNYGKPIAEYKSPAGIVYRLVSLKGMRAVGRVIATVQVVAPQVVENASLYASVSSPYVIDFYGNRFDAQLYQLANQNATTLMPNVPTNGSITLGGMSPEKQGELRLLLIPASEGLLKKVQISFENLKVEWD